MVKSETETNLRIEEQGSSNCAQPHTENKDDVLKVRFGTLTGKVDNAGDDNDRPPDQGHHGEHLGYASQTHGTVQVPLLQTVLGLKVEIKPSVSSDSSHLQSDTVS